MTEVSFQSFSSGSCGNCYLLRVTDGDSAASILIDAGVSLRHVKQYMASEGLDVCDVDAILVTHDHLDHIRSLGSFCKRLCKPVFATPQLLEALSRHTFTLDHIGAVKRPLDEGEWNEIVPGIVRARYFIVPHDATQTVGYAVSLGRPEDAYEFVIMTDIGEMTQEALELAGRASAVVVESNYDMDMLLGGPYPHELKMRICKGSGHLSNDKCAEAIEKFYHQGLRHIYLCHLSENNNTPQQARKCSAEALERIGAEDVELSVLPRRHPSGMFTLQR